MLSTRQRILSFYIFVNFLVECSHWSVNAGMRSRHKPVTGKIPDIAVHPADSLPLELPHPLEIAWLALLSPAEWPMERSVSRALDAIVQAYSWAQKALERRTVLDRLPRRTPYVKACKKWFPGSRSGRENDRRLRQILASLGNPPPDNFHVFDADEEIASMKSDGVPPLRMYYISRVAEVMQKQKQSEAGKKGAVHRWQKRSGKK